MDEYIERDAVMREFADRVKPSNNSDFVPVPTWNEAVQIVEDFPAADLPSALWTDEPISGTEFMTHNQGQSGFEIHFRTDDKAKYEAVQDECRRQIDHAKPAADVRPVVRGRWKDAMQSCHDSPHVKCSVCGEYYWRYFKKFSFCPNCGADMREES